MQRLPVAAENIHKGVATIIVCALTLDTALCPYIINTGHRPSNKKKTRSNTIQKI